MRNRVRWWVAALAIGVCAFAQPTFAVPVIDGVYPTAAGEWDADPGLIVLGVDPNEAAIPDPHDIFRLLMVQELAGAAADDGLYVLFHLYAAPSFVPDPPGVGPVFFFTGLDFTGDGLFTAAGDRKVDIRLVSGVPTLTVTDGTGAAVPGAPVLAVGGVVEYFLPIGMLPGGALPLSGSFNTLAFLDNGGAPPDDFIPDTGLLKPIPEPSSLSLLGVGGVGLLGMMLGFGRRLFSL